MWNKFKSWISSDKPWYKNWKVWLLVFLVLVVIGVIAEATGYESPADRRQREQEEQMVIEQQARESVALEESKSLAEQQASIEEERNQEKIAKNIERQEAAEEKEAQDQEVQEIIQSWISDSGYNDVITGVYVNDLVVHLTVDSSIDAYGDNQKEEFFYSVGSRLNNTLIGHGHEDKNIYFLNRAGNEIASYTRSFLGDYQTELND